MFRGKPRPEISRNGDESFYKHMNRAKTAELLKPRFAYFANSRMVFRELFDGGKRRELTKYYFNFLQAPDYTELTESAARCIAEDPDAWACFVDQVNTPGHKKDPDPKNLGGFDLRFPCEKSLLRDNSLVMNDPQSTTQMPSYVSSGRKTLKLQLLYLLTESKARPFRFVRECGPGGEKEKSLRNFFDSCTRNEKRAVLELALHDQSSGVTAHDLGLFLSNLSEPREGLSESRGTVCHGDLSRTTGPSDNMDSDHARSQKHADELMEKSRVFPARKSKIGKIDSKKTKDSKSKSDEAKDRSACKFYLDAESEVDLERRVCAFSPRVILLDVVGILASYRGCNLGFLNAIMRNPVGCVAGHEIVFYAGSPWKEIPGFEDGAKFLELLIRENCEAILRFVLTHSPKSGQSLSDVSGQKTLVHVAAATKDSRCLELLLMQYLYRTCCWFI